MKNKIEALHQNNTWKLVSRPRNKKVLTNRWVFKTKYNKDGSVNKYKARLVARGHTQRKGIDYKEVFAPVTRYKTIRTLLAAAVECEMHVHHMDVISAYTQGNLKDEIYMEQPVYFIENDEEDNVCKLLKPLYGLKQSGREWYKKLDEYFTTMGARRTEADPCVYVFERNKEKLIMTIYVDDIILASKSMDMLMQVKSSLKSHFKVTDLGPISNVLGIDVERNGVTGSIKLSQKT